MLGEVKVRVVKMRVVTGLGSHQDRGQGEDLVTLLGLGLELGLGCGCTHLKDDGAELVQAGGDDLQRDGRRQDLLPVQRLHLLHHVVNQEAQVQHRLCATRF